MTLVKKRKTTENQWLSFEGVEQQGIEPWSKHGINMLSTCLAFCWFSNIARKKAPKLYLSFCYFTNVTKQNVD